MIVELLLFGVLLFLLWKSFSKPPGLPPGRWGLPLVGYIPLTTKSMEEQVMDLHKQHGSIVLWRIGTEKLVFINNYKLAKEAFNRPELTDRPNWDALKILEEIGYGVVSSNGPLWHTNRRFTLRELRDLGMGKSKLVEKVQQQALKLRETIAKEAGTPGEIPKQLFVSVTNVIWHMVASVQFDDDDKRFKEFIQLMTDIPLALNYVAIKDTMPWLSNVMPDFLFKRFIKYHELLSLRDKFLNYFFEEIEKHRATLDPNNPRDLTDAFLLSIEEKKDEEDTYDIDRNLAWILMNMFFAGTDTTAETFTWLCCYLASHPHVQDKLHAEIDTVLPNGTLPSLAEKSKMPYTEAMINEVMRISSLVNFGVQHMASTDVQLGGYTIPKGAVVSTSTTAIHRDETCWDTPHEFQPERWLDEDGKFSMKKEGFVPFGVGKRLCVGESLARMELYILTAVVFQGFTISPPPGKTIDLNPQLREFFFRKARHNKFVFTKRQQQV